MLSRLVLFAFLLLPIAAQEIGVDLCACQPAVYSVRLQLNLTCADATVTAGLAGIRDITCIVDKSTDANVTDFQPTIVNEIQFLETDQNGNIVQQNLFADGYVEGDIVEYTSFLLGESSDINAVSLPSALSVFVTAQNAAGEPIINTWAIQFNNDCSVHPVLTVGQRIGWTVFNELQEPPVVPLVCPVISSMPSESPSGVPTLSPNLERTSAPVVEPSLSPIEVSTSAPVVVHLPTSEPVNRTMSPVSATTSAPVTTSIPTPVPLEPTLSPMAERTSAPVVVSVPTAAPVDRTMSPVVDRTSAPAVASVPTTAPVDPTQSPIGTSMPALIPVLPTMSPNADKTSAPSCELNGKRQTINSELSAPTSPAVGKRKSNRPGPPPSPAASSPGILKRKRRRRKSENEPENSSTQGASNGKRRGSDHDNSGSIKRRLHVGPHAPYAYPSDCPESLP